MLPVISEENFMQSTITCPILFVKVTTKFKSATSKYSQGLLAVEIKNSISSLLVSNFKTKLERPYIANNPNGYSKSKSQAVVHFQNHIC